MTKDLFIACHEELIAEAVANGMDEAKAYDSTADKAYDRMRDRLGDMADREKDRLKDASLWPPRREGEKETE